VYLYVSVSILPHSTILILISIWNCSDSGIWFFYHFIPIYDYFLLHKSVREKCQTRISHSIMHCSFPKRFGNENDFSRRVKLSESELLNLLQFNFNNDISFI